MPIQHLYSRRFSDQPKKKSRYVIQLTESTSFQSIFEAIGSETEITHWHQLVPLNAYIGEFDIQVARQPGVTTGGQETSPKVISTSS